MVMQKAGFEDLGGYLPRRKNTATHCIAVPPISDLCKETVQRTGAWFVKIWWERGRWQRHHKRGTRGDGGISGSSIRELK